ncbi:MAG: sugar phosphate isomerase/epimerase family protein [bacterium]
MGKKFTSSPWGFRFYTFEKYCQFMKKIGISDICAMFGDPCKFPLAFTGEEKEITDHKRMGDELGVNFLEVAGARDFVRELPLAHLLGVKYFRVCHIWEDTEEKFRWAVKTLKEMGQLAQDEGITVVLENHGGLLAKASNCRKLLEEVGMENVKLNYDPANFLYYGEDPVKALDEVLPLIDFTHFKSVKYENGKPKHCRLNEGVIDYKKIFEKLLPSYSGYLGLEYEESKDVERGTMDDLEYLGEIVS